jgi:iron complex outermembrane receptor protein
MKHGILLILFCLSTVFVLGQTIRGTVANSETGDPIIGASIYFMKAKSGTVTNLDGQFNIKIPESNDTLVVSFIGYQAYKLEVDSTSVDTIITLQIQLQQESSALQEVVITSSSVDLVKGIMKFAAGVQTVQAPIPFEMKRFSNTSFLGILNTYPGVKMESRGPGGSRRISIRGSMLRSPFGVRNIKLYWNEIPLTSPDGASPLEVIDVQEISSGNIIRGPSGNLHGYGAPNGGVLAFESQTPKAKWQEAGTSFMAGSNGLLRYTAQAKVSSKRWRNNVLYIHQDYAGYRDQEANGKDQVFLNSTYAITAKQQISLHAYHYKGFWELPGAIDSAAMAEDPTQALAYSKDANAAVNRTRTRIGLHYRWITARGWSNNTTMYGNTTDKENPYGTSPFFNGYKFEEANGYGGRTKFGYHHDLGRVLFITAFGAEYQTETNQLKEYTNDLGNPGLLKIDHDTKATNSLVFAKARFDFPFKMKVLIAGSYYRLMYDHSDLYQLDSIDYSGERAFAPNLTPSISVVYQLSKNINVIGEISNGYSAPTLWEVSNTDGSINTDLEAETAVTYELAVRGSTLKNRLTFDVMAYTMPLQNAIVPHTLSSGLTIYENTGSTLQNGVEAMLGWSPRLKGKYLKLWTSITLNDFKFDHYVKDGTDYSGNDLTGSPKQMVASGIDFHHHKGFYASMVSNYVGETPIDDANSVYADAYAVLSSRIGFEKKIKSKWEFEIYTGVENILDEQYTSFLQLNGFGGKYYNPAPGRSFYIGTGLKYKIKSK